MARLERNARLSSGADAGSLSSRVMELASQGRKIEAIKACREETGVGLKEAKELVESMMAGR